MSQIEKFREGRVELCRKAIEGAPVSGFWWPELGPLTKPERAIVLDEVKRRRVAAEPEEVTGGPRGGRLSPEAAAEPEPPSVDPDACLREVIARCERDGLITGLALEAAGYGPPWGAATRWIRDGLERRGWKRANNADAFVAPGRSATLEAP